MSHASNSAELSAREAASQLLHRTSHRNVERLVGGSLIWQPKLLTAVLGELVKPPSRRTWETAATAARLLEVLRNMQMELNLFHYNGAINVCQKCSAWELAIEFLDGMPGRSIQPDYISYNAVLGACGEASCWQLMLHLLNKVPLNLISFNTAAKSFDRSGRWQLALHTLDLLRAARFQPDLVSYGSVMNGLAAGGRWKEVGHLLQLMSTERLKPDLPCFTSFIKACGKNWLMATKMLVSMEEAQVVPDLISYTSAVASCSSREWPMALHLFHATAPDVPLSNAVLMSLSWQMAMQLLQHLKKSRIRGDEITRNVAAESFLHGMQWPSALNLFQSELSHLSQRLPARVLPMDQWQAALETLGGEQSLTPEQASQAAGRLASAWELALQIFQRMDLTMVQRDEQNWNDAVAACPSDAWQVALHALPAMLEARMLPSSSSYQAAILGADNAMEMFMWCRDHMTAAAACGTLAKLLVNDPDVIHANMATASRTLDDVWSPQEVSNLWWSCAMLGVSNGALCRKLKEICLRSLHLVSSEALLALAVGASAGVNDANSREGMAVLCALQKEISLRLQMGLDFSQEDILGTISAFKLAGWVPRQLKERARDMLQKVSSKMDLTDGMTEIHETRKFRERISTTSFTLENASVPAVVLGLSDRAVLYKPPGWEVHDAHLPKQLRTFAAEAFPGKAILQDTVHNCGFLHRLDVPNSGLLLVATSYGAYYDLQLQLAAGQLGRDYLVLVHGTAALRQLQARVSRRGDRSVAGGRGRPSRSHVLKISKTHRGCRALTLMHLQIVTGRQHQIRCQLAHIGHPVVCDGLYSSWGTFQLDCRWCPRNWLHRWRLSFDAGTEHQVSMALPQDLVQSLDEDLRETAESWTKNRCQ